jgi:DNA-binding transcriptional LysR family regulator
MSVEHDLDLTTLRLFVTVCEAGNIARAAERANIVASAISKRIARLEAELGTALLQRRGHGLVPTQAGEALLEHARGLLDAARRLRRDLAAYAAGSHGEVRMLASSSVMAEWLADDLAAFLHEPAHAGIQVDVQERASPDAVRGVREGQASFGVCWDAVSLDGLATRPYRSDRLCVVAAQRHPLAARQSVRFVDTLAHEHVALQVNSVLNVLMSRAAAEHGVALRSRIAVSGYEAALRVVRAGLAICVAPLDIAAIHARASGLRTIALDEPWARRRFVLCLRDEAALSPAARLLVAFLAGRAQGGPDQPPSRPVRSSATHTPQPAITSTVK